MVFERWMMVGAAVTGGTFDYIPQHTTSQQDQGEKEAVATGRNQHLPSSKACLVTNTLAKCTLFLASGPLQTYELQDYRYLSKKQPGSLSKPTTALQQPTHNGASSPYPIHSGTDTLCTIPSTRKRLFLFFARIYIHSR